MYHICFSLSRGGLELSVPKLAQVTRELGYHTYLVAPPHSLVASIGSQKGFPIITSHFRLMVHLIKLRIQKAPIRSLDKLHELDQEPIFIFHRSRDLKWLPVIKLVCPTSKSIFISHMMLGLTKKDFYHRWLYQKLNHVVTFSKTQLENHLSQLPIQADQISWLWHSVDLARFHSNKTKLQAKSEIGYNKPEFLMGCVGRFDPQKGQLLLVKACQLLKSQNFNFHLMLVGSDTEGEGGTLAQVRNYVLNHKLQNHISFYEATQNIEKYFQAFDLFVMPSDQETYGLVLVEAMLSGTLCMAFKKGGPIDILDQGRAGILVESSQDPALLASAISNVIQNPSYYSDIQVTGTHWAQTISCPNLFKQNFQKLLSDDRI